MQRLLPLLLASCALVSCDPRQAEVRKEPVVVYASYSDENYLAELFEAFTATSGIPVTVKHDSSETHAKNLIFNIGSPPADVFLSRHIADLWATADEGALRPITAANLENVPQALRDADKLWTALNYQQSLIVHRSDDDELPADIEALANRQYQGRVCVSTSALPVNRLLLAMLIDLRGQKETERIVRLWMRNLAAPPYKDETAVLAAVDSGECEFAILSGWQAAKSLFSQADVPVKTIQPATAYVQIEGIGVARHSRYPESAQKLVNWLLDEAVNKRHALALQVYPAVGGPFSAQAGPAPAVAGWRDEEAALLAERAGYR